MTNDTPRPDDDRQHDIQPAPTAAQPTTSPDAPTVPFTTDPATGASAPAPAEPAPATLQPAKRGRRTALLAGGAVLGAALLVGGGVAVGAALDDDDDRDSSLVSETGDRTAPTDEDARPAPGAPAAPDATTPGTTPDATTPGTTPVGPAEAGAATADELIAIVDAATAAAPGSVVSIDGDRTGTWEVQVIAADGSESEVRVDAAGTATVTGTEAADADDAAPQNVLDAATLRTLVAAVQADTAGRILDVDADDDARSPFDISVLAADRRVVEITLDTDGSVIRSELDD